MSSSSGLTINLPCYSDDSDEEEKEQDYLRKFISNQKAKLELEKKIQEDENITVNFNAIKPQSNHDEFLANENRRRIKAYNDDNDQHYKRNMQIEQAGYRDENYLEDYRDY